MVGPVFREVQLLRVAVAPVVVKGAAVCSRLSERVQLVSVRFTMSVRGGFERRRRLSPLVLWKNRWFIAVVVPSGESAAVVALCCQRGGVSQRRSAEVGKSAAKSTKVVEWCSRSASPCREVEGPPPNGPPARLPDGAVDERQVFVVEDRSTEASCHCRR